MTAAEASLARIELLANNVIDQLKQLNTAMGDLSMALKPRGDRVQQTLELKKAWACHWCRSAGPKAKGRLWEDGPEICQKCHDDEKAYRGT